jgi:hypothetical protein
MDTLETMILASFLVDTQRRLAPAERVPFHHLLRRRGGCRLVRSWAALLRTREIVVWVGDHAVTHVRAPILVDRKTPLSITPGPMAFARLVTAAGGCARCWN